MTRFVLALMMLSSVAMASSIDFTNQGGKLTGSSTGLTMTDSELVGMISSTTVTGDLGTVSFSTGSLASGNLKHGGVFRAGGDFTIIGNSSNGLHDGTIFAGAFDGPVVWSVITLANGTHNYTLTGTLSGTWFTGQTVSGATVQLTVNTGKGFFNGKTRISSGDTDITGIGKTRGVVPEPGTLGMLGTGLLFLAGKIRKQLVA